MRVKITAISAAMIVLVAGNSWCVAQPLVTGDLSVYYSFDEVDEDGIWADDSGNNLHGLTTLGIEDAEEDGMDDIRLETGDKIRGAGAALFATDTEIKEDYIAVCDPINQPDHNDGCGEFLDDRPAYVPSNAFTLSAWLKVEDVGADHSIWQSRAGGGGFIHTQVQGNGNVRFRLRGDANSDNIVQFNEPPGDFVEYGEWFHFAGTYDGGAEDDFGEFAIYFNGEEVFSGEANGSVAGDPDLAILGDWAQGGFIGLVPDFNRQLVGLIDEFYLFSRALPPEEINTLFVMDPITDEGDYNGDGVLDSVDIDLQAAEMAKPADQQDTAVFDHNADNAVNTEDRTIWVKDLRGTWVGDSNLDNEFNSGDLVVVFGAGKYETGETAGWAEGDWSGDQLFDSGDLVVAFTDGGYELGPPAPAAVPEPSSLAMLLLGLLLMVTRRRR